MSLVPWHPFEDNENLSNFFDFLPFRYLHGMSSPNVDVYQTADDVVVKAEIPGVSKEDLNLYIDENSVRLSGQTRRDKKYKDEDAYRTERYYGSFSRTIPLPPNVKYDQAKAEYRDGILTITMPKAEFSKPSGRKIDIQ